MSRSPSRRSRENDEQLEDTKLFNDSVQVSDDEDQASTPKAAAEGAVASRVAKEMETETKTIALEAQAADKMRWKFRLEAMQDAADQVESHMAQAVKMLDQPPDAFAKARAERRYTTLVQNATVPKLIDEFAEQTRKLQRVKLQLEEGISRLRALRHELHQQMGYHSKEPTFGALSSVMGLLNSATDIYRSLETSTSEYSGTKLLAAMLQKGLSRIRNEKEIAPASASASSSDSSDDEDSVEVESD